MSDWQAGDDGICITQKPWSYSGSANSTDGPSCGQKVKVRRVGWFSKLDRDVLWLEGWPGDAFNSAFDARNFVKITPGHKITGSEVDQKQPWKVGV